MIYDIRDIYIANRRRAIDHDKVRQIASSIADVGLINPITITPDGQLIAGMHRLEAVRSLGLAEIDVTILDLDPLDTELAEIDENLQRNDLTVLEQSDHLLRRNQILEEKGMRRTDGRYPIFNGEIISPLKTTAEIAADLGLSERSAQQRVQIARDITPDVKEAIRDMPIADSTTQLLALARELPARQNEIASVIVSNPNMTIPQAKQELKKQKAVERIEAVEQANIVLPVRQRSYRVIYADPPWKYGNNMPEYFDEQAHHYPLMTVDEICNMPVDDLCMDDAVLFLWATSPILPEALDVVRAWGFTYKSSFVWDKVKHNMGHYNSVRHEFLLICVRGSCQPDVLTLFDSVQSIERTHHSEKPPFFREIIDTIYPRGPRIELFARHTTEGWDTYGNEVSG